MNEEILRTLPTDLVRMIVAYTNPAYAFEQQVARLKAELEAKLGLELPDSPGETPPFETLDFFLESWTRNSFINRGRPRGQWFLFSIPREIYDVEAHARLVDETIERIVDYLSEFFCLGGYWSDFIYVVNTSESGQVNFTSLADWQWMTPEERAELED